MDPYTLQHLVLGATNPVVFKIKSMWHVGYNSVDSNFVNTNLEKLHLVLHKQKLKFGIKQ